MTVGTIILFEDAFENISVIFFTLPPNFEAM